MKKEKKDKDFLHKPVFPGGVKAMRQLIRDQMQYPELARQEKIEGTVSLRYTINYQGEVTDVQVIAGMGYGCDEEAIRLVKLFRFEVSKNRKMKVLFHKTIQIHFRLAKTEARQAEKVTNSASGPSPTTITYKYVPGKVEEVDPVVKKVPAKHYTYTIYTTGTME